MGGCSLARRWLCSSARVDAETSGDPSCAQCRVVGNRRKLGRSRWVFIALLLNGVDFVGAAPKFPGALLRLEPASTTDAGPRLGAALRRALAVGAVAAIAVPASGAVGRGLGLHVDKRRSEQQPSSSKRPRPLHEGWACDRSSSARASCGEPALAGVQLSSRLGAAREATATIDSGRSECKSAVSAGSVSDLSRAESELIQDTLAERVQACGVEIVSESRGVDSLSVRRVDAPVLRPYARGHFGKARAALRSVVARAKAKHDLQADVYARTTQRSRRSREQTLRRLAATGAVDIVPVTPDTLRTIAAALKAGGYRSGFAYLSLMRQLHGKAGHEWSSQLQLVAAECKRSLERGAGPARRAAVVNLEVVMARDRLADPVVEHGPIQAADCIVVAAAWMMRGAEAAAVLGEQVEIDAGGRSATIELGPTKTNPAGRECPRTLRCCCGGGESTGLPSSSACPVHALERVLHARAQRGMDGKMPLFPTLGGSTPTRRAVISTLRHLAGDKRLTEHSMRRMGAQYYARHGVPTAFIEFLGRWGGPTVLKYIGEALRERASDASVIARRNARATPL